MSYLREFEMSFSGFLGISFAFRKHFDVIYHLWHWTVIFLRNITTRPLLKRYVQCIVLNYLANCGIASKALPLARY